MLLKHKRIKLKLDNRRQILLMEITQPNFKVILVYD